MTQIHWGAKRQTETYGLNCKSDKIPGKIWRIDVGSSSGFDNYKNEQTKELSKPQVLEIIDDNEFNILS